MMACQEILSQEIFTKTFFSSKRLGIYGQMAVQAKLGETNWTKK